ncbi:AIPR family protein [Psychrobacter sp. NPDC064578]|uniref:AIPR family protein n=1 Tax=Psychrobacter sp. NPDC064578 TaxID=3364493 RepID=UPI00384F0484
MTKFETLIKIIDELRKEAPEGYKFYYPLETEFEKLNQARSRAYIHLFLKVKFGILDFEARESYITDGAEDGGIDAYYIDTELKTIFFIQSKFRVNEKNFESREIKYEELLNMDLDRVLDGEEKYESGIPYNNKVKKLISELRNVNGLGRYSYEVIILANTKKVPKSKLEKITGRVGNVSEYNFERSYEELLFPVVTGTFYNNSELIIEINLSDKSSEDISYSVETEFTDCQISVLFVPTVEIAKTMYKYKNSILKYNPRSYLDLHSNDVNKNIENTIKNKATNEFALFNNGITMLSDETFLKGLS